MEVKCAEPFLGKTSDGYVSLWDVSSAKPANLRWRASEDLDEAGSGFWQTLHYRLERCQPLASRRNPCGTRRVEDRQRDRSQEWSRRLPVR